MTVQIRMHSAIQDTHSVVFEASPGDYLINGSVGGSTTLQFNSGNWNVDQGVDVTPLRKGTVELKYTVSTTYTNEKKKGSKSLSIGDLGFLIDNGRRKLSFSVNASLPSSIQKNGFGIAFVPSVAGYTVQVNLSGAGSAGIKYALYIDGAFNSTGTGGFSMTSSAGDVGKMFEVYLLSGTGVSRFSSAAAYASFEASNPITVTLKDNRSGPLTTLSTFNVTYPWYSPGNLSTFFVVGSTAKNSPSDLPLHYSCATFETKDFGLNQVVATFVPGTCFTDPCGKISNTSTPLPDNQITVSNSSVEVDCTIITSGACSAITQFDVGPHVLYSINGGAFQADNFTFNMRYLLT